MNFDDTPQEAAFRKEVRSWIDANAPKHLEAELKRASFGSNGPKGAGPACTGPRNMAAAHAPPSSG
jgi:hypothetical protein